MTTEIQSGQIYRHYKGQLYKTLGLVKHSETLEDLVLYECLYDNPLSKTWVRPLENFLETIEIDGKQQRRFRPVEGENIK
ncbi:MAG: DUF1653 domain-containing protein [Pseudomonadota bacterium]